MTSFTHNQIGGKVICQPGDVRPVVMGDGETHKCTRCGAQSSEWHQASGVNKSSSVASLPSYFSEMSKAEQKLALQM